MKKFISENIVYILLIVLFSLVVIFWGRIIVKEFKTEKNHNNLTELSDRIRCAESFGWEVDKASETKTLHYIPKEITDEFLQYNEMQKSCGFDLTPYMGKGVTVYTYRILNFPNKTPVNAYLNIITYNDRMIGGDCVVDEFDDLCLSVCYQR